MLESARQQTSHMPDLPVVPTRATAQRRADRIRQFQAELAEAERDGALELTADQRSRLDAYHASLLAQLARTFDVDVSDKARQLSRGMQVVAIIGAIALAASVVLFFAYLWGRISTVLQVTVLIAAPLAAVGATELMSRRQSLRFLTGVTALVAFACFILNLEFLGQIFALTPTPEAVLAYGVLALALAYAYGQRLLLAVGAVCLSLYLAASIVRLAGGWWLPPGLLWRWDSFVGAGAALVLWSFVPHRLRDEFPGVLRGTGLILASVAILIASREGTFSWLPFHERVVQTVYQVLSLVVPAVAIGVGIRRGSTDTLAIGGVFFSVALFIKYVDWWWDWMPRFLFFLVVGATALVLLWLFGRVRARVRVA